MFISNAQKIFLTWNLFQNYFLKRSPWKGFPLNNFEGFALLSNKLVPILPLKDLVPSQDSFLQISEWRNWKYFPGKYVKALKIAYIKIFSRGPFQKTVLKVPWSQKRMFWPFEYYLSLFCKFFEWRSCNHYLGKQDKALKVV